MNKRALASIALLALLIAISVYLAMRSFARAIEDTTDANRYQAILQDLGYPKPTKLNAPTLGHFPAAIPASATNVRFFYRPHFLQGGTLIHLRLHLPPDEIAALLSAQQPASTQGSSGNKTAAPSGGSNAMPNPRFRNSANTGFDELPKSFRIFVHGGKYTSVDNGYSYGVAIDERAAEIIYWLDDL